MVEPSRPTGSSGQSPVGQPETTPSEPLEGLAPPERALDGARVVDACQVPDFVRDELMLRERNHPIVAVTTATTTGAPWLDVDALAARLAGRAEVVMLVTGEATWALAEHLPPSLDVYGGAVRIWRPGLSATSRPADHPLLFARSEAQGESVRRQLLARLLPGPPPGRGGQPRRPPGDAVRPDAWKRLAEEYAVGQVVRGRVQNVKEFGAFVELLPGANGLVHKSQMDFHFVNDPSEVVSIGDLVHVEILSLDAAAARAELSIKKAYGRPPRPAIALAAGELPFLGEEWLEQEQRSARVDDPAALDALDAPGTPQRDEPLALQEVETLRQRVLELESEVETLDEDRHRLVQRLRRTEHELRSTYDRLEHLRRQTAPETDPLSSEHAFLLNVRLAYARTVGEGERLQRPLLRMRVGPEFLARVRELEGVSLEKVVEVCAQVACGLAHAIPAREVHQLRAGEGGSPVRTRERDGAKAWRCSLQDNTASARRLHWWSLPGEGGGGVEFASVGVHDDYSMPG